MLDPFALLPRDAAIAIFIGCVFVTLVVAIVSKDDP
jgi:hypothetical protein